MLPFLREGLSEEGTSLDEAADLIPLAGRPLAGGNVLLKLRELKSREPEQGRLGGRKGQEEV